MRVRVACSVMMTVGLAVGTALAQDNPNAAADLLKDPSVKAALDAAKASEPQTIEDQIRFCEVPGVKQLLNQTRKGQIDRFVSIDGTGLSITNVAVGSHRYRVTFKGPGGHSFGAFGLANPIDAMGRAIARIAEFQVPKQPKTT